jgi:hypothetical protein
MSVAKRLALERLAAALGHESHARGLRGRIARRELLEVEAAAAQVDLDQRLALLDLVALLHQHVADDAAFQMLDRLDAVRRDHAARRDDHGFHREAEADERQHATAPPMSHWRRRPCGELRAARFCFRPGESAADLISSLVPRSLFIDNGVTPSNVKPRLRGASASSGAGSPTATSGFLTPNSLGTITAAVPCSTLPCPVTW